MNTKKILLAASAWLLFVTCLGVKTAHADLFRWTVTGNIESMSSGFWDGSVTLGTPITMTTLFDSTTAPFFTESGRSLYVAQSMAISFGDYVFTPPPSLDPHAYFLGVIDNQTFGPNVADGYQFANISGVQYGLSEVNGQGFLLSSNTSLLNSTSLPVQAFSPSVFDVQSNITLQGYLTPGDYSTYQYVNTDHVSTTVEAVPEPSNALVTLLAIGGVAIFFITRRRQQQNA